MKCNTSPPQGVRAAVACVMWRSVMMCGQSPCHLCVSASMPLWIGMCKHPLSQSDGHALHVWFGTSMEISTSVVIASQSHSYNHSHSHSHNTYGLAFHWENQTQICSVGFPLENQTRIASQWKTLAGKAGRSLPTRSREARTPRRTNTPSAADTGPGRTRAPTAT